MLINDLIPLGWICPGLPPVVGQPGPAEIKIDERGLDTAGAPATSRQVNDAVVAGYLSRTPDSMLHNTYGSNFAHYLVFTDHFTATPSGTAYVWQLNATSSVLQMVVKRTGQGSMKVGVEPPPGFFPARHMFNPYHENGGSLLYAEIGTQLGSPRLLGTYGYAPPYATTPKFVNTLNAILGTTGYYRVHFEFTAQNNALTQVRVRVDTLTAPGAGQATDPVWLNQQGTQTTGYFIVSGPTYPLALPAAVMSNTLDENGQPEQALIAFRWLAS